MEIARDGSLDTRVLVVMPVARDAERARQLLQSVAVSSAVCADLAELCRQMRVGAGALLITNEVIEADRSGQLRHELDKQPPWSSLPVLVLAREVSAHARFGEKPDPFRGMVVLERPARTRALLSTVESALRARRSQYAVRDAIALRERQAAELAEQDEKLRFALSAGRLGSWELELETQEMVCSEICKSNYGRPPAEPFTYAQLHESVHPLDRERVLAAIQKCLESDGIYDIEYRVLWPNGETHWALVRGRAIFDAHNVPRRMVGVSMDITEREQMHEALQTSQQALARQADQLRAADRMKDEFLATLAHELRNPLAPIRTGLSLLANSPDPVLVRKSIGVMQRQVGHMVRLVDDLLDISRVTQGKLELKRTRMLLQHVVDAAVEASQPGFQRARQTLRVELPEEALVLEADFTRIAQVIGNLLNNASKYSPNGSEIRLEARRAQQELSLSVHDEGIGIPEERLQDVFAMFSQVNTALDRSQGGLGIGLALVRQLVEMHGGSVAAASAGAGKGSTFTIRLPLAAAGPVDSVSARPTVGAVKEHRRILVVDDNEDAAELLGLMLQQAGYEVTTAIDGASAIDSALALTPSIILLDIGLPGMNGYEVAEQLRKHAQLAQTTLIALTGWGSADDKRRAATAGFDMHLTKPVSSFDLQEALERATSWQNARDLVPN